MDNMHGEKLKKVGVMYGVVAKYKKQMDLNRDMFQRRNCLHLRVAVTAISLLETDKIRDRAMR